MENSIQYQQGKTNIFNSINDIQCAFDIDHLVSHLTNSFFGKDCGLNTVSLRKQDVNISNELHKELLSIALSAKKQVSDILAGVVNAELSKIESKKYFAELNQRNHR